jgi:hypothetical protein
MKRFRRISRKTLSVAVATMTLVTVGTTFNTDPAHAVRFTQGPAESNTTQLNLSTLREGRLRRRVSPSQVLNNGDARVYKERRTDARIRTSRDGSRRLLRIDEGAAVIRFQAPLEYFGFLWRSPNPGNMVQFFSAGELVGRFRARDIFGALAGNDPNQRNSQFINFFASRLSNGKSQTFDEIRFFDRATSKDGRNRFQVRRLSYRLAPLISSDSPIPDPTPIPSPALLSGLVGMGVAAIRKRQQLEQNIKHSPTDSTDSTVSSEISSEV